eukprot:scaffold424_cov165-Ochromonas_danica.AAC.34
MPLDFISSQLKAFRAHNENGQKALEDYSKESPYERTKREVKEALAEAERYRVSILKGVTTFGE